MSTAHLAPQVDGDIRPSLNSTQIRLRHGATLFERSVIYSVALAVWLIEVTRWPPSTKLGLLCDRPGKYLDR